MPKTEKTEKVAELTRRIESADALILTDYRGLSVGDAKELRSGLREADASFIIVKNTLMKLASEKAGKGELEQFFTGPTAVAFIAGDPVLAAKRLSEAQKKIPTLQFKGGFMEGRVLSATDAQDLARLESREAMLSKLAGLAKTEMSRAASGFQAVQSRFRGLLESFKERVPGEAAAGEAAAEESREEVSGSDEETTAEA
jgi:large subunit ribosomal protein L10